MRLLPLLLLMGTMTARAVATQPIATEAAAPPAIYAANPEDLWNRLYAAIAVRTEAGVQYGADNGEPFFEPFDDPRALAAALDEFIARHGERAAPSALARALLLNDVWAAFDLAASARSEPANPAIQHRLAEAVGQLRLPAAAISRLPDNYRAAVESGNFAADFDPAHPQRAFLPPDLLDAAGSWVEIQDGGGRLVTPFHAQMLSGRSVFRVFIRCPGGRTATLAYLNALNLYPTPWELKGASIGRSYPGGEAVRMFTLRLDPATPQFPAGTIVALVRQLMAIDDRFEPVPTALTQKVQFRVYREVGVPARERSRAGFSERQRVYEFVLRRRELLAGSAGGLRLVGPQDVEYQLTTIPEGGPRAARLQGSSVLGTCERCHSADGIFSVNSYTRQLSPEAPTQDPQLLPSGHSWNDERAAAVQWKQQQFDWGLLRGMQPR